MCLCLLLKICRNTETVEVVAIEIQMLRKAEIAVKTEELKEVEVLI